MASINSLYRAVFEDISSSIYSGSLKKGTKLPTLNEICAKYGVSRNTARSALALLEENGFIRTFPGKSAVVLFDFNDPVYQGRYITMLLQRQKAIANVFDIFATFMPDIIVDCLHCSSPAGIQTIQQKIYALLNNPIVRSENELMQSLMELYGYVLSFSGNPLLLHLFNGLFHFIHVPLTIDRRSSSDYASGIQNFLQIILRCLDAILQHDDQLLKQTIVYLCEACAAQINAYLERLKLVYPTQDEVHFTWFVQKEQEFLYAQIVVDIMDKIYSGQYAAGHLLPSYAELAKLYGVSERTSRKAIAELKQMQLVQTLNGVGTTVLPPAYDARSAFVRNPKIEKRLEYYLYSVQLVQLTCRPILRTIIAASSASDMISMIRRAFENETFSFAPILGRFLEIAGSREIETICRQIKNMLVWGACLDSFRDNRELQAHIQSARAQSLDGAATGNFIPFTQGVYDLYTLIFDESRSFLQSIQPQ